MFTDNLSNMASQPFSVEINRAVEEIIWIFKKECTDIANKGGRSIVTTAKYDDDGYYRKFDFGTFSSFLIYKIPENMRESFFARVVDRVRLSLIKEGFHSIKVETTAEGPFYNRKRNQFIRISATW